MEKKDKNYNKNVEKSSIQQQKQSREKKVLHMNFFVSKLIAFLRFFRQFFPFQSFSAPLNSFCSEKKVQKSKTVFQQLTLN